MKRELEKFIPFDFAYYDDGAGQINVFLNKTHKLKHVSKLRFPLNLSSLFCHFINSEQCAQHHNCITNGFVMSILRSISNLKRIKETKQKKLPKKYE